MSPQVNTKRESTALATPLATPLAVPMRSPDEVERERCVQERARRWRLALGASDELRDRAKRAKRASVDRAWSRADAHLDKLLAQLYGRGRGGLEGAKGSPTQLFKGLNPRALDALDALDDLLPHDIAELVRAETTQRLDARAFLQAHEEQPELQVSYAMLEHLVYASGQLSDQERQRARELVAPLIDELKQLFIRRVQKSFGPQLSAESEPSHTQYVPPREINWPKTILANLRHYQPERRLLIPERLIRRQRRDQLDADLIICLDHSGSMASSVIHASIYAAALASVPGLHARVVIFNDQVCDLSASEVEPVDVIFASRPHGGTDILGALRYCREQIKRPEQTTLVFISDLIDGTPISALCSEVSLIKRAGAEALFILALSDEGHPMFSDEAARALASLGTPALCCTPEKFPDLIRDALKRESR